MNLYEKINLVKENILKSNLKKSGRNSFAKYEYYELSDFLPVIIQECKNSKIYTNISFNNELATLTITNTESVEEKIVITSPMKNLELKGCNEIQALGGVETYQRRYLLMSAFDIIENDLFDSTNNKDNIIKTVKETFGENAKVVSYDTNNKDNNPTNAFHKLVENNENKQKLIAEWNLTNGDVELQRALYSRVKKDGK